MVKRVLIIATNGFEQSELLKPRKILEDAGYETILASPDDDTIKGWHEKDWGKTVDVDLSIDEVAAHDYDAVMLPGGQMNPDILRTNDKVISLIKEFDKAGKPVAAICHAPWLLIEAGIVSGKTVTSWPSVRTDLANAGANVVDKEVAVDGNLITSRNPDDIPAFSEALCKALKSAKVAEAV